MCASGTKQNKYVDKFFDLLTNWFISICFYHATFVSRTHLYCTHLYRARRQNESVEDWMKDMRSSIGTHTHTHFQPHIHVYMRNSVWESHIKRSTCHYYCHYIHANKRGAHTHTYTRRVTTTTMAEWHSQNQKQKLCLSTITHHTKYYRNALIRELSVCSRKIFKTWNYSVIYFGNKAVSRCGAQTVSTMKIKGKWRVNKTNVRRSYKNFALHLQHRNCVQCSLKGAQYAHNLRTSTHTHARTLLYFYFFLSRSFSSCHFYCC